MQLTLLQASRKFSSIQGPNSIQFFGPKGEYTPNFRPFGSHLGVPPGDGKFGILSLKYDSHSVIMLDFIGLVAHLNDCRMA